MPLDNFNTCRTIYIFQKKPWPWRDLCISMYLVMNVSSYASCTPPTTVATEEKPMNSERNFRVKGENIRINESELEAIRKVVIDFLSSKNDDIHRSLKEELQQSIAIVGPDDSRLGPWALTDREDSLVLIRIPPRKIMNYSFVAKLSRKNDQWCVTDFFQERMKAR